MSVSSCPSTAEIAAHVRERFSESIGAHLMECDSCMNLYERFFEERYGEAIDRIQPIRLNPSPIIDDTMPDRIGVYEIRKLIGRGGMGTVYEAVHTELEKPVAIKLLHSTDPHFLDRFQREKRIAGQFRHPNVVESTDAGTFRGKPYLVSELLKGRDLENQVKTHGPFEQQLAIEIVMQAAKGLACLHREGVVHRDIKPSNIFVAVDPIEKAKFIVKILDVGLAKLVDDEKDDSLTSAGDVFGTYDYIAPEQIKNVKKADGRSDIYSLGCTFYFLLTGSPPYSGKDYETKGEKIAAHLGSTEIPDVRTIRPEIPVALVKLVADMVAKVPERRLASADDILERIATIHRKAVPWIWRYRIPLVTGMTSGLMTVIFIGITLFVQGDKNHPSEVAPALEAASEAQADPPKPVEPSTTDSVTFHAKPVEADAAPLSETPPTIPTPSNVEPSQPEPPATVTDKSTSPQQPKEWNPGVRRPSETITLIPSGKFDDDEEEEE